MDTLTVNVNITEVPSGNLIGDDDPYTMTEEELERRKGKRYNGRCITQAYAGVVACVGSMAFGVALGWTSPLFSIVTELGEVSDYKNLQDKFSWIASMVPFGICMGVPVWNYINLKFGPKHSLFVQNILLIGVWVLLGSQSTSEHWHMACRFFCGFLSISYTICGETLLLDSVDLGYLRDCVVFFRSFVYVGVIVIYIGGQAIQQSQFSYIPCGIIGAHTILLLIAPESPVYTFRSNETKAVRAVEWYRGKVDANIELQNLKRNADFRKQSYYSNKYMLYSKVVVKGILIVVGITFVQVFTGYYAFIFFNGMIWQQYGGTFFNRYVDTVICGFCLFISRAVSTRVHYSIPYGVYKPLILSATFTVLSLAMIVAYCMLWEYNVDIVHRAKWFPLVAVNFIVISYEMGLSIIPDILIYDYMPCQVYFQAKTIVNCTHWFLVFILIKCFGFISTKLEKMSYSFIANLACATFGLFYIIFKVVEVKDRPLVQIQLAIGGNPVGNRSTNRKQRKSRM